MKKLFLILIFLSFSSASVSAQKPRATPKKNVAVKPKTPPANESEEFEKAAAQTDLTQKIAALRQFATEFPKSSEKNRALELIVSAEAQLADEKLRGGETAAGIELFKQAVADAPVPMSDKLFSEVVLQFPTNLFYGAQQRLAAIEIAKAIEEKVSGNAKQILGLATFYIGTENGSEARRLANKAIKIDPQMPAAYQTLGLADRLDFQLDESVADYTKAAELDPDSVVSKRSLAEMKRAVGKPDEAAALYRELLEKNPDDVAAQTGLTLALFDAEKQPEAEAEMKKTLQKNPNNLPLLVGASYWYAAHKNDVKTLELANRAIAVEPRYTWAHIAMARGFLLQNRYTDAEKSLLLARQYGNFPTLTYELAAVRFAAGFYEEAVLELKKSFTATDDSVETKLGNRISKTGKTFIELLAPERAASIFEPLAADSPEISNRLKSLFLLNQKLGVAETTDEEITRVVNEFVKGDDKARAHRQLYAANRLLQTNRDLPQALELTQDAVGGVDDALQVPSPAGAVMADQLFLSRTLAIARGEVIVTPDVPRKTLAAILRGRIEEIAGETLYNQGKFEESIIRLKRAVSVLPEKSAWWISSMWGLGMAFDAASKPDLALGVYVKSYINSSPDAAKYVAIEKVYQKVHGNLDGLDKQIGDKPVDPNAVIAAVPTPTVIADSETVKADASPTPEPTIEAAPEATPTIAPTPKIDSTPEISPTPKPKIKPEVSPTPNMESTPQSAPSPENKIEEKSVEPKPSPSPSSGFEPIIIKIPGSTPAKTPKDTSDSAAPEKSNETVATNNSGETRLRVISDSDYNANCQLDLSQDKITLSAKTGRLGILVSFQGDGNISKIVASSGNPADVSVALDPDIGKQSNRGFFIIKSISPKTGIYTVTFDSPCGKKEVQVRVR